MLPNKAGSVRLNMKDKVLRNRRHQSETCSSNQVWRTGTATASLARNTKQCERADRGAAATE